MATMKDKTFYKGFDKDFKCKGFQFEIGKTYEHDGKIKVCESGFHSCLNPVDVLNYYNMTNRFAEVKVSGVIDSSRKDDSKISSSKITVKSEISVSNFIKICVAYLKKECRSGELSSSDCYVQLSSSEECIRFASSGEYSKLFSSGKYSQLASSGDFAKLASSEKHSQLVSSGDHSKLAVSGDFSKLASSGDCNTLLSTSNHSKLASSGNYNQLASSGEHSRLTSLGIYSNLASTGDFSNLTSSGNFSKLEALGESSVISCSGPNGKVKGGKKCALSLTRYVSDEKRYRITVAYVGENGIKEDTWYELDVNGNFVETI